MNDPGMAYLNALLDDAFLLELRSAAYRQGYRHDGAGLDEQLENESSRASGDAQDEYEEDMVYEARAIVAGTSAVAPTVEHLRILLGRIPQPVNLNGSPF